MLLRFRFVCPQSALAAFRVASVCVIAATPLRLLTSSLLDACRTLIPGPPALFSEHFWGSCTLQMCCGRLTFSHKRLATHVPPCATPALAWVYACQLPAGAQPSYVSCGSYCMLCWCHDWVRRCNTLGLRSLNTCAWRHVRCMHVTQPQDRHRLAPRTACCHAKPWWRLVQSRPCRACRMVMGHEKRHCPEGHAGGLLPRMPPVLTVGA